VLASTISTRDVPASIVGTTGNGHDVGSRLFANVTLPGENAGLEQKKRSAGKKLLGPYQLHIAAVAPPKIRHNTN
jgi:hypothetical protein